MIKEIELSIFPTKINDYDAIRTLAAKKLNILEEDIKAVIPVRRSIDARSKFVVYRTLVNVFINEEYIPSQREINYSPVSDTKKVIIVGFGPAGMFAALRLLELGIKPIVFDRGKDVQERRRDLRNIQQNHIVNPESNYCFGEGGAGTYSDGKLYTRATKRGDIKKILNVLVNHGANEEILIDSHPHIGSNKLPKLVTEVRETIIKNNGEVHFNSKITDLIISNNRIKGVVVNGETEVLADAVVLATGHSARDIYYLLKDKSIILEAKQFAMGVRIEHPQKLINEIQYHTNKNLENVPAASYGLSCTIDNRGIYSFCMCPGGIMVPSATNPGEVVVNGMSLSRRDSKFANSGFVVSVLEQDYIKYKDHGVFAGLMLQQEVEQLCFRLANNTQSAPTQKVTDFINNKLSDKLNESSYIPGVTSAPLHSELPKFISKYLKIGLHQFDKNMKGFYTEEAQITAAESRTSSPIRIPRNKESLMHIQIKGLYPCGEGAGYAGGIVSAALDGENCANAIGNFLL